MYGVMIPEVSAGSNQVGASEMCTAQFNCPCGAAARATPGAPATLDLRRLALRPFQRDVLVRPGISESRDQPEPGFSDAGPRAVDETELPDRRGDRPLVNELLDPVQDRLALFLIEFDRLPLE